VTTRRSVSAHEWRIVTWLNSAAAALFWIGFAISLDWWQMATAIFFTLSAVVWAINARRKGHRDAPTVVD
jgi:hypothetical protein